MSGSIEKIDTLIELAQAVGRAEAGDLESGEKVSIKRAAQARVWYRLSLGKYLDALSSALRDSDFSSEALEPLTQIKRALEAIDLFGATPPLFQGGGMPFGHIKPIKRLWAEGHAVGCVEYLHGVVGFQIMDACKAVASMFSHMGHARRTKASRNLNGSDLSSKTLHQWYVELQSEPEHINLGWTQRSIARYFAIDSLLKAELAEPTVSLPQDAAREKLAERVMLIAVKTLIDNPDGAGWTLAELNSGSSL